MVLGDMVLDVVVETGIHLRSLVLYLVEENLLLPGVEQMVEGVVGKRGEREHGAVVEVPLHILVPRPAAHGSYALDGFVGILAVLGEQISVNQCRAVFLLCVDYESALACEI